MQERNAICVSFGTLSEKELKKAVMKSKTKIKTTPIGQKTFRQRFVADMKMNGGIYMLFIPVLVWYLLFRYKPLTGLLMAFENYSPRKGITGSEWVGLKYFAEFIKNPSFWKLMRNTLNISVTSLIFAFPAPIVLALMLNEVRNQGFKRSIQTVSYFPHFISVMVVCGLIKNFTADSGLINNILSVFGIERRTFLNYPEYFVPVYVISDIWTNIGWDSIIYFAALTGIDQQLYEAAQIDGAGRWKQTWHITLPGILPTIITMLILKVGNLLNVGYEKVFLLYNPLTYDTADIITTYTYRMAIGEGTRYGYSTAVGLFNAVLSFLLLILSNTVSKKAGQSGLW